MSWINPRHFNSSIRFFIKLYCKVRQNYCIKLLYSHHLFVSLFTPNTCSILHLANINNSINSGRIIADSIYQWLRDNLIIDHLITNTKIDAAFYSVIASFKIDFKCNIYVYKTFLAHTESITH